MSDYSLQRQPIEREASAGAITMREIEDRVEDLLPRLSLDDRRNISLLFAILKQGTALQKLQWFTHYDLDFIREAVEELRSSGQLFTGNLSTQFVLNQVPGCEDLIERITGQRIVRPAPVTPPAARDYDLKKNLVKPVLGVVRTAPAKPKPKEEAMEATTTVNGAAEIEDFEPICGKTEECDKPLGHTGRCKGPQPGNIGARARLKPTGEAKTSRLKTDSPEERKAANAERMRQIRAQNKSYGRSSTATPAAEKAAKAAPVAAVTAPVRTARTARPAPVVAAETPCHFTIEFEDETETIKIEGSDRATFKRKLKSLYEEFAGESNV